MSTMKSHSQQTIDSWMRAQHEAREAAGKNKLTEDDIRFLKEAIDQPDPDLIRLTEVIEQVGFDAALDLKDLVAPYLAHQDTETKNAALRTLVAGLGQLEYIEVALEILQRPEAQDGSTSGLLDPTEEVRLGALQALTRFVEASGRMGEDPTLAEVKTQRDRVLRALVKTMVQTKDPITAAEIYEDLARQLAPKGSIEPVSNDDMIGFSLDKVETSFLRPYWPDQQSTAIH